MIVILFDFEFDNHIMADKNRTLGELAKPNSLFANFPSLLILMTHILVMFVLMPTYVQFLLKLKLLQRLILFLIFLMRFSTYKIDVADLNVVHATEILSSIEQPFALELIPLTVFLEF